MKCNVINFHITEKCNFRCKHCFAKFKCNDQISLSDAKVVVDKIKEYFVINGISDGRINIAGGEPFLYQGLGELIEYINGKGIEVSIITNGFLLMSNFIQQYKDKISMIGISVDSLDEEMCINLGRCTVSRETLNFKKIVDLGREIKFNGIMLKYNIVLTKLNCKESVEKFKELFLKTWPDRIKLIQMRVNDEVNDKANDLRIEESEFEEYCRQFKKVKNIVVESDDDLESSYIIIDPAGNLISNKGHKHETVGNVLENQLTALVDKAGIDYFKFSSRYKEKKYFEVGVKFGHVGTSKFYKGTLYLLANSRKEAAQIAREYPRVKHHHKEAILYVHRIEKNEYIAGRNKNKSNLFFTCTSTAGKKNTILYNIDDIYDEGTDSRATTRAKRKIIDYEKNVSKRYNNIEDKEAKRLALERVQKKMNKYGTLKEHLGLMEE